MLKKESKMLKAIPGSMGVKFSKANYNGKTGKYDVETDENGISYIEDTNRNIVLSQCFIDTKKIIECKYCGIKWKHFHQCEKYKEMEGYYERKEES